MQYWDTYIIYSIFRFPALIKIYFWLAITVVLYLSKHPFVCFCMLIYSEAARY